MGLTQRAAAEPAVGPFTPGRMLLLYASDLVLLAAMVVMYVKVGREWRWSVFAMCVGIGVVSLLLTIATLRVAARALRLSRADFNDQTRAALRARRKGTYPTPLVFGVGAGFLAQVPRSEWSVVVPFAALVVLFQILVPILMIAVVRRRVTADRRTPDA